MKIQISDYNDYKNIVNAIKNKNKKYSDEGVEKPFTEADRQGEEDAIESASTYAGPVPNVYR